MERLENENNRQSIEIYVLFDFDKFWQGYKTLSQHTIAVYIEAFKYHEVVIAILHPGIIIA